MAQTKRGPSRSAPFVQNPAWTTDAVVTAWDLIRDSVKPAWLPLLDRVTRDTGERVSGRVHEYGCGMYGCVFPTHEPEVVLKVTTDASESEFSMNIAPTLVRPVAVYYYTTIALNQFRDGRRVYLLWRESAHKVGQVGSVLGARAVAMINQQHAIAQEAFVARNNLDAYMARVAVGVAPADGMAKRMVELARKAFDLWVRSWRAIAAQDEVPQLRPLGAGMVACYEQQRIFFGDVHDGNVGLVHRPDGGHWVITDPGYTSVIPDVV